MDSKINESMTKRIMGSIAGFRLPRFNEITNVGLYLEQTAKFINGYLSPLGGTEITGSMVSNYVKQKLVPNPVKKQYYTEHIAVLMFIAIAKTVTSLDDIRLMLSLQSESCPLDKAYDHFCDSLEAGLRRTNQAAEGAAPVSSEAEALMRIMIEAIVHKIYLDQCLTIFRSVRDREEQQLPPE
ncbi:MAG: DUF1836 domain-containing protein [Oscillospiraceae bacterium]|nr:DUF1836 domain-containing protein [Oscillospiraceae bacterium]